MLGKLKQRAALLAKTLAPDGGGGFSETWQAAGSAWVEIVPLSANEKFGADALELRIRHRITMRVRADVVAGMRLTTDTRTFLIRAVERRDAREPLMVLLCEELP